MLVFGAIWIYLAYDTPDTHPTITEAERSYIKEQIGKTVSKNHVSILYLRVFKRIQKLLTFQIKNNANINIVIEIFVLAKTSSEKIGNICTIFGIIVGSFCQYVGNLFHFNKRT